MVTSIDGRLLVDRWTKQAVGIEADMLTSYYNEVLSRFHADGWIVGRKTMQYFARGAARTPGTVKGNLRDVHIAARKDRDVAVSIDPRGTLHYGQDNAEGDHIIAILGEQVSDEYLAELREDNVSHLFAGAKGNDMNRALEILGDTFGVKTLFLEGGGITNGLFLKERLIDEISLLVYPAIDGLAGILSIFESAGKPNEQPAAGQALRHIATETLKGGMAWLRYNVEPNPAISQS
jgi:riboflavin biosynthesis pyrimidine reductase